MAYIPVINQGLGNGSSSPWAVSGTLFIRGNSAIGQVITDVNAPILMAINDKGGVARFVTSANAVSGGTGQGLMGVGNLVLGPDSIWRGMQGDTLGNAKVIHSFNGTNVSGNVTSTLKTGSGLLHSLIVNTKGTGSTCKIYDNTSGAGLLVANIDTTVAGLSLIYDVVFTSGLTIVAAGSSAADLTISWI